MNKLLIICFAGMLVAGGCKVRRISDGKPPDDGIVTKTRTEVSGEVMTVEEEYRNGELVRETVRSDKSIVVFERFPLTGSRRSDSTRIYYGSGQLQLLRVKDDSDRTTMVGYFENGSLQFTGNDDSTTEYYENGSRKFTTLMRNQDIYQIKSWHQNGVMKEFSEWQKDERNGRRLMWDSTGAKIIDERYANGVKIN